MAFPGSRYISFVANTVPVIGAGFLNAVSDWIAAVTNATVSVLGLNLDGAGGLARTGVAGAIKWFNTAAGGGNPARATALTNELRAVNIPKAWARIQITTGGAIVVKDGANIFTVTKSGGDAIRFTFASPMDDANYSVAYGGSSIDSTGSYAEDDFYLQDGDFTNNRFDVHCGTFVHGTDAGVLIDPTVNTITLMVQVFGRQTTA